MRTIVVKLQPILVTGVATLIATLCPLLRTFGQQAIGDPTNDSPTRPALNTLPFTTLPNQNKAPGSDVGVALSAPLPTNHTDLWNRPLPSPGNRLGPPVQLPQRVTSDLWGTGNQTHRPTADNGSGISAATVANQQDLADLALPGLGAMTGPAQNTNPIESNFNAPRETRQSPGTNQDLLLAPRQPVQPRTGTSLESEPLYRPDGGQRSADQALEALPSILPGRLSPFTNPAPGPRPGELPTASGPRTDANPGSQASTTLKAPKYDGVPLFMDAYGHGPGPQVDSLARPVPYDAHAFAPTRIPATPLDPYRESLVYRGKRPVPVQRPLVELWRPLFGPGIYPPAKNWFGRYNPVMPHFLVYGDYRMGYGIHDNGPNDINTLAFRANLDMDLELTATERIHAFMGPLDRTGDFTRIDFQNGVDFIDRTDIRLDTLFFEGDAGAMFGGITDQDAPFDLPLTLGLIPFFYQNGIWANDAALGAAFAIPARHSRLLKWSNFDATFFWASDQVTTQAFAGDNNAAEFFGTAWFIEAYDGYWEVDYAFIHDDVGGHRSYHNFSVAFTKRYFHRVSNSIRFITNFDQALPRDQRTAQGHLLLIENAWISSTPNTLVPYLNFFYGQGQTQSLARAGVAGGILTNTGINFEPDGLTGFPTLDATGVNTVGGAVGVNLLGQSFEQQLILEAAALKANGSAQFRNAAGDQYAVGIRYQRPLTNAWIFRTDHMLGFLRNAEDIRGSRVELRFKF